ncbi:MAG: pantoate--beta-alanine ligase [Magnetococcus sp. DMHC-6]
MTVAVIEGRLELDAWRQESQRQGWTVGFVPTMGGLHEGHLTLVDRARHRYDKVVVSIFVNPTQFAPGEDYLAYPRELEKDRHLLDQSGCDLLFCPEVSLIYPHGHTTCVEVGPLGSDLCGASRPGHFRGVATVVAILLNLVRPHGLFLGLKDYQQYILLSQMVRDLAMPVVVEGVATVREENGLALSSRNRYLTSAQREQATALYQAMLTAQKLLRLGEQQPVLLEQSAREVLHQAGIHHIDYVAVRQAGTLERIVQIEADPIILIAVRVGKARLIDNMLLTRQ